MTFPPEEPYIPIADYGLVGNMRTAALIGRHGAVDWLCLPSFDSPSVFCALLDAEKGGRFQIAPADENGGWVARQVYWPDTNVLITRFAGDGGAFEVVDYMPVGESRPEGGRRLVRRVQGTRGRVRVRVGCRPAFDYARQAHTATAAPGGAVFTADDGTALALGASVDVAVQDGAAVWEGEIGLGDHLTFTVHLLTDGETAPACVTVEEEAALAHATIAYWRGWLKKCTYTGRWREQVRRSALALKLLTYEPTGAILAAPTTSLPECLGGGRNWDYRYSWIRDAAFTMYGLLRIGFTEEVRDFIGWLQRHCDRAPNADRDGPLQIVYGIDGRRDLPEETLDHLDGYKGSRPVRIGNGAAGQLQLDIYGELLDAVYLYDKYGTATSFEFWGDVVRYLDWLCENWEQPDEGVWEVRGPRRHFVYSKLMSWVALDRGLRLASKRSLPAPRERWIETRDRIYACIMENGWNEERGAFVQAFGSDALDASNLLMPLVFFLGPNDPRILSTLDATLEAPEEGGLTYDCLVWRYNLHEVDDGVEGDHEGAFTPCTFWLVEALARAGRTEPERLEQAQVLFEKMLDYASPLGLFGEQTSTRGRILGNYPQAFSHLGFISAAFNLDRALDAGSHPTTAHASAVAALPPGASPTSRPGM